MLFLIKSQELYIEYNQYVLKILPFDVMFMKVEMEERVGKGKKRKHAQNKKHVGHIYKVRHMYNYSFKK